MEVPKHHLALQFTSRQTYKDTRLLPFKFNSLEFRKGTPFPKMREFFERLSEEQRDLLKKLHFGLKELQVWNWTIRQRLPHRLVFDVTFRLTTLVIRELVDTLGRLFKNLKVIVFEMHSLYPEDLGRGRYGVVQALFQSWATFTFAHERFRVRILDMCPCGGFDCSPSLEARFGFI
ncbi:hypothetical protein DM02DRAFT_651471 [Periconia macrospinosa]|uniref:Uncharacterized protein n=1 Tax=Periconia macrospinosa TaxID=97972 RepID=A0A2V1E2Z9_9PLEO|nr:hypothetical protein DM02DRAFT_651471 [Periconia macrospinosa]